MCVVTFGWKHTDAGEKFRNFDRNRSLSWVVLEITEACNLNCKWCYASSTQNGEHMSLDNVKKILDTLKSGGVMQVTFSGGEPLVHPYIREAVKEASDRGFIVHMNTNGWLLTRELAQEMKEIGLSQVQINIDSIEPGKHDQIRGREGSFEKSVQAMKNAQDAGIVCTSQTVLTKENEGEIFEIFNFARSLGVERCRVWDMTPAGRAKEQMSILPTDYIETLKKLTRFAEETGAVNVESGDPLYPLDFQTALSVTGGYCVALAGLYTTISVKGDVYFCAMDRTPMYNILQIDGKLINTHSKRLNEHKEKLTFSDQCKYCKFKTCLSGCFARRTEGNEIDYICSAAI